MTNAELTTVTLCVTRFCARPYLLCGMGDDSRDGGGAGGHGRAERAFHTTLGKRNLEINKSRTPYTIG